MIVPRKGDFALFVVEIPGIRPHQSTARLDSKACVYLGHTDLPVVIPRHFLQLLHCCCMYFDVRF